MKKIFGYIIILLLLPLLIINVVTLINSFINPDKVPSFLRMETIYSFVWINGIRNICRRYSCSERN